MPKLNNVTVKHLTVNADVEFTPEEAKALGLALPGVQGKVLALEQSPPASPSGEVVHKTAEDVEIVNDLAETAEDRKLDAEIEHNKEAQELYAPNGLYHRS